MLLGHATLQNLNQYLRVSINEIRAMHGRSRLGGWETDKCQADGAKAGS